MKKEIITAALHELDQLDAALEKLDADERGPRHVALFRRERVTPARHALRELLVELPAQSVLNDLVELTK